MEIFGRTPHTPTSSFEWLLTIAVLSSVAIAATRAADWPSAVFLVFSAIAFGGVDTTSAAAVGVTLAALVAYRYRGRIVQPESGPRALREGSVLAGLLLLYAVGLNLLRPGWHDSLVNTQAIIDFERNLHIDPEAGLQRWLLAYDRLLPIANAISSWLFLPLLAGTFGWLYLTQDGLFRQFRSALAISGFLGFCVFALHPIVAPGHMPGSGLVDTLSRSGSTDGGRMLLVSTVSLHVGWVALSGAALFFGTQSRLRWIWLIGPTVAMILAVMATGQSYVVDWFVGITIALGPFLVIQWVDRKLGGPYYFSLSTLAPSRIGAELNAAAREIADVPRLRATVYSLGALLTYLIVRQVVDPGFTRYWGYMVAQIALTILIVIVFSVHFSEEGGFSVLTHSIVIVTTYADTLGTAAHMYDRFISYDKFTHFFGCAAVASAMGDLLINMSRRGTIDWPPVKLLLVAAALAIGAGMAWEIYEYIGDHLLDTGRHNGRVDTTYDLISDTIGAIVAICFLYWWHFTSPAAVGANRRPAPAAPRIEDDLHRLDLRDR